MPRATLIIDSNQPDELAAADAWFERWRTALTYVSDDDGCGCCVSIYHVEGPAQAIAATPTALRSQSEWTASLYTDRRLNHALQRTEA